MRRWSTASACGVLAIGGLAGAGRVDATTPPEPDDSETALEQFVTLGEQYGFVLVDPACSSTPSEGTELTYTCYAITAAGDPFIARTSLSGTGVIEFEIVAAPGEVATADPGGAADTEAFNELGYFATLFSGDATAIATLQQATAPGSPAEAYAIFQLEQAETAAELGQTLLDTAIYLTPDGVRICTEPTACFDATDLQVVNGELVNFSVGGEPIAPRLARPAEPIAVGTSSVTLRAAYRAVSTDSLAAFVELTARDDVRFELSTAVYIDAEGNQTPVDRELSVGSVDLALKGTGTVRLVFPGADPGGSIRFLIHLADGTPPLAAVIPVTPVVG